MVVGLALQAVAIFWLSQALTPTAAYGALVVPFALAGVGMALVFVLLLGEIDLSAGYTGATAAAK